MSLGEERAVQPGDPPPTPPCTHSSLRKAEVSAEHLSQGPSSGITPGQQLCVKALLREVPFGLF